MSNWIKVTEKFPEKNGDYLVVRQAGGESFMDILPFIKDMKKTLADEDSRLYDTAYRVSGNKPSENVFILESFEGMRSSNYVCNDVTHWTVLPKKPAGVKFSRKINLV
jgi:hypothetical protein